MFGIGKEMCGRPILTLSSKNRRSRLGSSYLSVCDGKNTTSAINVRKKKAFDSFILSNGKLIYFGQIIRIFRPADPVPWGIDGIFL